jgi:early B-cell factor
VALYDRSGKPIEIERTAFVGFVEKDMVSSTNDIHSESQLEYGSKFSVTTGRVIKLISLTVLKRSRLSEGENVSNDDIKWLR